MKYEFLSDEINAQLEVLDIAKARLEVWLAKQDSEVDKSTRENKLAQFFREEWAKRYGSEPTEDEVEKNIHPLARDEDDLDFDEMNDVWDELDELDACGE